MKVSILTIGDEILNGTTIDTNAVFMAENLISEGIDVSKMLTVSDTEDEIVNALDFLKTTAEVIFITGGLGPTKDDITVKTLAKYVGQDLVFNEENYNHVNMLLSQRRKKDIEVDKSRCMFPEKTIFLNNQKGTAPGMWLEKNGVILISMPGVPLEMKQIFIDEALPKIKASLENYISEQKLEKATLIGHSLGGSLALWLATEDRYNFKKIIIVDTLPSIGALMMPNFNKDNIVYENPYNKRLLEMSDEDFEKMATQYATGMSLNKDKHAKIKNWILETDRETYAYGYTDLLKLDLREDIAKIKIPVSILGATHPFGEEAVKKTYQKQYKNLDNYTIKYAKDAAHFIMYDQPEWFLTTIKTELE